MFESIIVAIITALVPTLATAISSLLGRKRSNMHNAKQSIMQLILEDKISVMEGGHAENYQNVLMEFDDYQKAGGNHYIEEKVTEYQKWYKEKGK